MRRTGRKSLWFGACCACVVLVACSTAPNASDDVAEVEAALSVPADFSDARVASVPSPTAIAFTPDGRLLITTQGGALRVVQNGTLVSSPALDLSAKLCTNSERGLLGVAVDPNFASNRFIYLYYTFRKSGACPNNASTSPVNRVARFTFGSGNLVDAASELVLIDNVRSPNGNHNGGDLKFGKDGNLYVSIGDGGCDYADASRCAGSNDASRDAFMLLGKILRIRPDGSAPPDNPNLGSDSDVCRLNGGTSAGRRCRETYASGLRNPFRMAFDPNAAGTRFFINDVGQDVWEEIDQGQAGADYGWNSREGHCANGSSTNCGSAGGFVNPIFDYNHAGGCASITGGAFVPSGAWPAAYEGGYLFADYVCGKIFLLKQSAGSWQSSEFATAAGGSSVVAMGFGTHQGAPALFYTTYAGGGEVRRIVLAGANNQPPVAAASASPRSGSLPLTVAFDGSASSDPNPGDTLSYSWDFGDGTAPASGVTTTHTYTTAGPFTATLTVRDPRGASSAPTSLQIQPGNAPPSPSISAPASGATFRVGQTLTLSGSASDAQDGALPATSLSWTVLQHHNTHTHPYLPPTRGNDLTITAPAPEDLAATQTSYLEVQLTATDSQGLSATTTRNIEPHSIELRFESVPAGRTLIVNGVSITAPASVVSWEGYALNVEAPAQAGSNFVSWSDGGAQAHMLTSPATPATYTATFSAAQTVFINFQPSGVPVPPGYLADTGAAFGNRGNGRSYGWNANNAATARDRDASNSTDQRYDTLQHMQKPENPDARWELQVPNGRYRVRVVAGDADYTDSVFRIQVEGVLAVSGTPSNSRRWLEGTVTVDVTDGKLTLRNGSGASNNKLCFLEVSPQ